MKVQRPANNPNHVLSVAPRTYPLAAVLMIRNKLRDDDFLAQQVVCEKVGGHLVIPFEYPFTEGATYEYHLNDLEGNLMLRDTIFATDQTDIQNYKLTNG